MIAYGITVDAMNYYVRVGESTALECLRRFDIVVIEVFGPEYSNKHDIARLLAIGESTGFLCMLSFIDYMHWGWKNCPHAFPLPHTSFSKTSVGHVTMPHPPPPALQKHPRPSRPPHHCTC
jgi:hypothetical protein